MIHPYGWAVCVPHIGDWRSAQSLDLLQPDRWMNWSLDPQGLSCPGFTPMVWGRVDVPAVQARMRANPGETVLLFNEPERPKQANLDGSRCRCRNAASSFVAGWDTDADFNTCGPNVAINTHDFPGEPWLREYMRQLRLKSVNRLSQYGIHLYNSHTRAHVRETWDRLEEWRGPSGFLGRDTPIVVTEFCAADKDVAAQIEVMDEVHTMLLDGSIKGAYWYMAWSTSTGQGDEWPNCRLCEVDPVKPETMRLTELGKHWLSLKQQGV